MTGGRVVVLGATGRNFAAGMSGGIAYLLDEDGETTARINPQMVEIGRVDDSQEADELKALIQKHVDYTGSEHARAILAAWPTKLPKFLRVIPKDYKRVLACLKRAHDQGLSGDEAIMAAFEENARDLSRVGGN
jgi:glutamate synthase (ferredoxin)